MTGQQLSNRHNVAYHYGMGEAVHRTIWKGKTPYHFQVCKFGFGTKDGRHFTAMNVSCVNGNTREVYKNTNWYDVQYTD